jgi:hypothetical protein
VPKSVSWIDPHHLHAEPDPNLDPSFHFDADSDPTFHFDMDPDPNPAPHQSNTNLHCKKGWRYSRPQPGCHLPNFPWPEII